MRAVAVLDAKEEEHEGARDGEPKRRRQGEREEGGGKKTDTHYHTPTL